MEQQKKIISIADLPQVRVLGRTTGKDVINLFWTGSGIEFLYTGSELWLEVNADYDTMEPWLAVELNGAQISRFPVNKGKNEVCLFRGMTVGKPKHVRFLKWIGEPDAGKEKEENDLLITKLRTQTTDLKKNRGMEENYMLFGEMLDEERRQGQKEGLQQGKMDILLKLLQEHKIDVKTAASIMGMNEDEFAKAVKECQEV